MPGLHELNESRRFSAAKDDVFDYLAGRRGDGFTNRPHTTAPAECTPHPVKSEMRLRLVHVPLYAGQTHIPLPGPPAVKAQ